MSRRVKLSLSKQQPVDAVAAEGAGDEIGVGAITATNTPGIDGPSGLEEGQEQTEKKKKKKKRKPKADKALVPTPGLGNAGQSIPSLASPGVRTSAPPPATSIASMGASSSGRDPSGTPAPSSPNINTNFRMPRIPPGWDSGPTNSMSPSPGQAFPAPLPLHHASQPFGAASGYATGAREGAPRLAGAASPAAATTAIVSLRNSALGISVDEDPSSLLPPPEGSSSHSNHECKSDNTHYS